MPLLNALFGMAPIKIAAGNNTIQWLLDHTLGAVVDMNLPPQRLLLGINLFILAIFLIKNIFDFLQQYLVVKLEQSVTRDLRRESYDHLLDLDMRFFGVTRAGQIITRLTSDADQLRNLLTNKIAKFVTSILQVIITLVIMLEISTRLTLVCIIVLPAIVRHLVTLS
jgi:ATP-binding cassette subfamily B protein